MGLSPSDRKRKQFLQIEISDCKITDHGTGTRADASNEITSEIFKYLFVVKLIVPFKLMDEVPTLNSYSL